MKAIIISLAAAVLTSVSVSVNANNPKVYSNVEITNAGTNKEYVYMDDNTSMPKMKTALVCDANGMVTSKVVSEWKEGKGWVNSSKYEYKYNSSNKVSTMVYTEWSGKSGSWADVSDMMVHLYDNDGNFLSVEKIKVENNNNFYSGK